MFQAYDTATFNKFDNARGSTYWWTDKEYGERWGRGGVIKLTAARMELSVDVHALYKKYKIMPILTRLVKIVSYVIPWYTIKKGCSHWLLTAAGCWLLPWPIAVVVRFGTLWLTRASVPERAAS